MKKFSNLFLVFNLILMITLFSACASESSDTQANSDSDIVADNSNSEDFDEQQPENDNLQETTYNFLDLADEVVITDNDVTFVDAKGEEVTIQKNPQKVVGLLNSYTNLWYEAGGTVVGRLDSEKELPEEALDPSIETLGKTNSVNMELLLSLEPDLVLLRLERHNELIPQLEENNIPYIAMEYNSFNDYLKWLKIFTALNGTEEIFDQISTEKVDAVNQTIEKTEGQENPDILLIFGTSSSLKAYLSNTANGQILKQLGANNIADSWENTDATSIEINTEYLIESDPDFIFVQCMNEPEEVEALINEVYGTTDWWQELSAVKNDNVIYLDRALYHFKPNSRYDEAYQGLAEILYPDLY